MVFFILLSSTLLFLIITIIKINLYYNLIIKFILSIKINKIVILLKI